MQDVIIKLASEGGLRRIQELIEREADFVQAANKPQLYKEQIMPFFTIMSKPEILDSLLLETHVAQLYNFIYGVNGARAGPLFRFVAESTVQLDRNDQDFITVLERSIVVFSKVLDHNTLAAFQPILEHAARQLEGLFEDIASEHDTAALTKSATYLQRILRRLKLAISIPVSDLAKANSSLKPATAFPTQHEPPGGRHDNDFPDVCDIRILPTSAEIRSGRSEYLPDKDPSQWHVPGIEGLLDRSFRLLREDTVGQLRDAIQYQVERQDKTRDSRSRESVRTNVYMGASIFMLSIRKPGGFQFEIRFPTPPNASQLPVEGQKDWWIRSKRLQAEALVCLVDKNGATTFCVVKDSPATFKSTTGDKASSSSLEKGTTCANLSLVEPDEETVRQVLGYFVEGRRASSFALVEFPKILLPSFEPTLKALQTIKKLGDLPFPDLLAPSDARGLVQVAPPAYSRREGFAFDLTPLTNGHELRLVPGAHFELDELVQKSTLDHAQASSLVDALSRQFSLIQGPPGTGKSYTGVAALKVILASRRESTHLGPIICITYTNHALDQVLEDVLDSKITSKIIRMGSQSKSERLKDHNLRVAAHNMERTRAERHELYATFNQMDELITSFDRVRDDLSRHQSPNSIRNYLRDTRPLYYNELFGKDDEGFETAGNKSPERVFRAWLQAGKPLPDEGLVASGRLRGLSKQQRRHKYYGWIKKLGDDLQYQLRSIIDDFQAAREQQNRVRDECDLRCLRQADIIGVTTSGLARKIEVLRRVKSKVLLCEEAGEVLEPHLLSAFLPDIEHVLLIGDHLQLRPQVQNFLELSRESGRGSTRSLDVSLFERLVQPDLDSAVRLPCSKLEIQRRMHPSIAELIRRTLYPNLTDDASVTDYPEVAGMRKRLFWLDHNEFESNVSDEAVNTSHWNEFEIEMVAAVVMHLTQQGSYRSGEIAVLTPYLGQLHRLRRRLEQSVSVSVNERDESDMAQIGLVDEPEDVPQVTKSNLLQTLRVATIDNFQGEEAQVVVVSLVRSNAEGKCGFLKTPNRINVLLSRAKHGMYILGNSQTSVSVKMWADVIKMLRDDGNFGQALDLRCPRHPDKEIRVKRPEDFSTMSPEGGCNERCVKRLACGHACLKRCHSDLMHQAVHCIEPCQRPMKGCDHPCPTPCGDPCPKRCTETVLDPARKLLCGHDASKLPCWQAQDLSSVVCRVRVERVISGCGHRVVEQCFRGTSVPTYSCPATCGQILPCGHTCGRKCHDCRTSDEDGEANIDHGTCVQTCGRPFSTCAHTCGKPCHGKVPCPPCASTCTVSCGHSCCVKICSDPCTPCAEEKCLSACPHSRCSLPCAAPCDHVPCSRRCPEVLTCGHQCPSICGEVCPDARFCQNCADESIKSTMVDFIEGKEYREIDLDQTPCIFPRCGHFLTFENMDGRMGLTDHYDTILVGEVSIPVAIKSKSQPFSMYDIQTCPTCRSSLRNLARYGRQVRRALLDESTKKLIVWSNQEFVRLNDRLEEKLQLIKSLEEKEPPKGLHDEDVKSLLGDRNQQLHTIGSIFGRYDGSVWIQIKRFRAQISEFHGTVRLSEQPFSRVRDAIDDVRRRSGRGINFSFDESVLQITGFLQATSLSLRLDLAILVSFLSLKQPARRAGAKTHSEVEFGSWKADCQTLLKDAARTSRAPQQVEACLYLAQLCAIQRSRSSEDRSEEHRLEGVQHLNEAQAVCIANPDQTRGFSEEIVAVETMLRQSIFYSTVSGEERQAVIRAMATEFRGTGHWYYCQNGHPFTIGECGMPMETAVCPECSAPVGGQHHRSVAGNTQATDLEEHLH